MCARERERGREKEREREGESEGDGDLVARRCERRGAEDERVSPSLPHCGISIREGVRGGGRERERERERGREGGREGGGAVVAGGKGGWKERRRGIAVMIFSKNLHTTESVWFVSLFQIWNRGGGVRRHSPGPNQGLPSKQVSHFGGVVT